MSCIMIVTVAAIIVLRFAWPAVIMPFVFAGVTEPDTMAAVVLLFVVLTAAWLHAEASGRPRFDSR
jgi:hypothetical protein